MIKRLGGSMAKIDESIVVIGGGGGVYQIIRFLKNIRKKILFKVQHKKIIYEIL